jgi:hypothetical protein
MRNVKTRGRYLKAARLGLKPEHCRGMMQGVSADLFRVWQREALEAPTEKFGKEFRLFLSAIDDARGEMCTEAINRMLHHASDNDSETAAKWITERLGGYEKVVKIEAEIDAKVEVTDASTRLLARLALINGEDPEG